MDERGDSLEMMDAGDSEQPEEDPEALEEEPAMMMEGDGSANEGGEGGGGDEEDDGHADEGDDGTTADGTQQSAQQMQGSEVRPVFRSPRLRGASRPGSASAGCCTLGSSWTAIFTWELHRLGSCRPLRKGVSVGPPCGHD